VARYTGPACRICRRLGEKLMLKGERCASPKCPLEKSGTRLPGQHLRPRKLSDYALRLQEKQKARYSYGVMEKQFHHFFNMAQKNPGMTGGNLLQLLERRLDNVVYRLGWADSRPQSRQLVCHGHITVNQRKVDIPSYLVKPGDTIAWRRQNWLYQKAEASAENKIIPTWLNLNREALSAQVITLPPPEEVEAKFDTKMIVEYYSR
jgi:small subunit ribosomal protein S4